jgi:hypothetical protein
MNDERMKEEGRNESKGNLLIAVVLKVLCAISQ